MTPIDFAAIEQQARQLRAQEMQRIQGLLAQRLRIQGHLLGASLAKALDVVGDALRPLFSWNPRPSSNDIAHHRG